MTSSLTRLGVRLGLRRRTFRLYLTVVYGGLFLASGTALLAFTYWLAVTRFPVSDRKSGTGHGIPGLGPLQQAAAAAAAQAQAVQLRGAALHSLLVMSGVILAVMTVVSVGLGWLVAGRMLHRTATSRGATGPGATVGGPRWPAARRWCWPQSAAERRGQPERSIATRARLAG